MISNHNHQISNQQCDKYLVSTPQFLAHSESLHPEYVCVCVVM
jgi:hypothetical protein